MKREFIASYNNTDLQTILEMRPLMAMSVVMADIKNSALATGAVTIKDPATGKIVLNVPLDQDDPDPLTTIEVLVNDFVAKCNSPVIPISVQMLADNQPLATFLGEHYFLERRYKLETREGSRHPITYGVIAQNTPQGWTVFVYQRTPMTGEGRLAGNYSIGVGGHVEIDDIMLAKEDGTSNITDINLLDVIAKSFVREAAEEFTFVDITRDAFDGSPSTEITIDNKGEYEPILLINSDEGVDHFHLGIVNVYYLDPLQEGHYTRVQADEPDSVAVGFFTLDEIKDSPMYAKMESWSKKILEQVFASLK